MRRERHSKSVPSMAIRVLIPLAASALDWPGLGLGFDAGGAALRPDCAPAGDESTKRQKMSVMMVAVLIAAAANRR